MKAVFAFDNSQNHRAKKEDALVANRLKLSDGFPKKKGQHQTQLFRDGYWIDGQNVRHEQVMFKIVDGNPIQKGIQSILTERGLYDPKKDLPYHKKLLALQPDFKAQRSWLCELIEGRGHKVVFFPKFHCEFNFLERFFSSVKKDLRMNCDYSLIGLRERIPVAVQSVLLSVIRRYSMHCFRYMTAYKSGLSCEVLLFI